MIRFSPRKWDHITTCAPCLNRGRLGMIRSGAQREGIDEGRRGGGATLLRRTRGGASGVTEEAARCQPRGERESNEDEAEDDLPEMEMEK